MYLPSSVYTKQDIVELLKILLKNRITYCVV